MKVATPCVILLAALVTAERAIPRPADFYGSDSLLNGYCDDAQYFIDTFTLPSERLTVEGSPSDVTRSLATTNETGEVLQLINRYTRELILVISSMDIHVHCVISRSW